MAFDEALAERIRHLLARRKHVEEKEMFSGLGFLLNGHLLVGVRLGPEQSNEALQETLGSEFDITGRVMTDWVPLAPPFHDPFGWYCGVNRHIWTFARFCGQANT
jgi:hypothetical protein